MGVIQLLDENTINKIAAGEVIERPSSIVKELMENALDAGATSIQVEICDGGKTYISVKDNGCGILSGDMEMVFQRHGTSKIKAAEDLFHIKSLGFRGEAMASIAAVAEVELTSRSEAEEDGTLIDIRGGIIKQNTRAGHPVGTTVIVRNLFFNTPARKKFLKTDLSEQGSIADAVERQALANPSVSIRLIQDGKTVLHTPGNGDLLSVIQCIYGKNIVKSLVEVDHPSESMKITGYTSKTELSKGNSTYILCDFNGRPVKSRTVIEAVRQSYRNILMNNRYPFAILRIETNPELIDVNVHPQKHEIRVTDEKALFNTVYISIKSALNRSVMIFGASEEALNLVSEKRNPGLQSSAGESSFSKPNSGYDVKARMAESGFDTKIRRDTGFEDGRNLLNMAAGRIESTIGTSGTNDSRVNDPRVNDPRVNDVRLNETKTDGFRINENENNEKESEILGIKSDSKELNLHESERIRTYEVENPLSENVTLEQREFEQSAFEPRTPEKKDFHYRVIGQHLNTYILIQMGEDLFIVDQHAAHERINYEYLRDAYFSKAVQIQELMMPVLIEVSPKEHALYEAQRPLFVKFGMEMEWFGENTMAIRSVPMVMGEPLSGKVLTEIMTAISSENDPNERAEKILKSMACKGSVKAYDRLSMEEMEGLMGRLFSCQDPFNCPHGRPVIISFTKLDLEKRFKRVL